MIRLSSRPGIPADLKKDVTSVKNAKKKIEQKITEKGKVQSTDFPSIWGEKSIKQTLWKHHSGKCCYCERKLHWKRESDVEHFRPKSEVTEDKMHTGYWWLAYEWENYLFSCKICNSDYKLNHFPILPGGKRAKSEKDSLKKENPILIDPIQEDPEKFIGFKWREGGKLVKAIGLDSQGRGDRTVNELTGINDLFMMQKRAAILQELESTADIFLLAKKKKVKKLVKKYHDKIAKLTMPHQEFAGFRRAYFKKRGLGEFVSQ